MVEFPLATETSRNLQVVILSKSGPRSPSLALALPTAHAIWALSRCSSSINIDSLETEIFKPAVSLQDALICQTRFRPMRGQRWNVHQSHGNLDQSELGACGRANFCKLALRLHCTCAELATLQSGKQLRAEQGRGAAGEQGGGRIVG